nr:tRNA lysidine(34) synthetase TilS [Clostridium sp. AM30-24]
MAEKMEGKADADRRRFRQKVLGFMRNKHMTDRGDGVLAAVSGGADSVCLLLLLNGMAAELGIRVFAFHMNHGIRGEEADRDEQFVEELCKQLEIPLTVAHEKVETYAEEHGLSGEEAGRILRYRHLEETAERYQCAKIAVAHHEDDDAETVLLNLFRGSGLAGLSGIRPVRGKIIRPLLCVSRKEIEEYLKEQGFSWCEDSTNRENDYTRNKIRNELLPWVRENINSRAAEHILAASELAAQADVYFEMEAERILEESCSKRREEAKQPTSQNVGEADGKESGTGQDLKVAENAMKMYTKISTNLFDSQPEILKTYIIRRMVLNAAGKAKDITERHIRAVMKLTGPGGGHSVNLPYGLQAVRGYETIKIVQGQERRIAVESSDPGQKWENEGSFEKEIRLRTDLDEMFRIGPASIHLHASSRKKEPEIPKNQYTKWFDYDKINVGLSIRYRKNGDYLTLSGGGKKKLRRYMIDEKIPEDERDRIPVLADGDHVLWVIGYRISDYYKITDETEHILEAEVKLPDGGEQPEDGGQAGIWNCKGEDHG